MNPASFNETMDLMYSLALVFALVGGAIGAATLLFPVFGRRWPGILSSKAARFWAIFGCVKILVWGTVSALIHARYGHGPNSLEPLGFLAFFRIHPVYILLILLLVCAYAGYRVNRRRSEQGLPGRNS